MDGNSTEELTVQVTKVVDVRRWIAQRCLGAARMLLVVQASVEDLVGAIDSGQYDVAVLCARVAILECLSIRGLAESAQLNGMYLFHELALDPFRGLKAAENKAALQLITEGLSVNSAESAASWGNTYQSICARD